jgi:uncharacterized protein YhfF
MIRRIQFVSDQLVLQIIAGKKISSVVTLDKVNVDENEFNHALVVGEYYDVYDSKLMKRCTLRITAMELCIWRDISERLWRGESNTSAEEFRKDHENYFNKPSDDFEFIAYYFHLVE